MSVFAGNFRGMRERRQASLFQMFSPVMPMIHGKVAVLGEFLSLSLVGVCGMTQPGCCQPRLIDKLRILPQIARGHSRAVLKQFLSWTSEWSSHDPGIHHRALGT